MIFLCCFYHFADILFSTDIPRIDTDLICPMFHRCNCKFIVKMNIRDQRNMNLLLNLCKSFGSFHCWNSTANDLASSLLKSKNLFDRLFHIFCLCICHRLDGNWIASSNLNISNRNYSCLISCIHANPPLHENLYNILIHYKYHQKH